MINNNDTLEMAMNKRIDEISDCIITRFDLGHGGIVECCRIAEVGSTLGPSSWEKIRDLVANKLMARAA